jgi:hypothetical protein
MTVISQHFLQASVISDEEDYTLARSRWADQLFGAHLDANNHNQTTSASSGVSRSYLNRVNITPTLIEVFKDAGISLEQIVAAYESLVVTGFIPHIFNNGASELTDKIRGSGGVGRGFYGLKMFVSDCWRISDEALRSHGIHDPDFYRAMAVAYFAINHRFDRLGYSAIDWHKVVQKVGYKDFFGYLALRMNIDFGTIKKFADDGIDFELAKSLLTQTV